MLKTEVLDEGVQLKKSELKKIMMYLMVVLVLLFLDLALC